MPDERGTQVWWIRFQMVGRGPLLWQWFFLTDEEFCNWQSSRLGRHILLDKLMPSSICRCPLCSVSLLMLFLIWPLFPTWCVSVNRRTKGLCTHVLIFKVFFVTAGGLKRKKQLCILWVSHLLNKKAHMLNQGRWVSLADIHLENHLDSPFGHNEAYWYREWQWLSR